MTVDTKTLEAELGPGPMRFAPSPDERSVDEQLASLTDHERECVDTLKSKWEAAHPDLPFSDAMYLRFARCSPGQKKFNTKASWKVMKAFDHRYLSLTAETLEGQLLSQTLFPVPGLRSNEGHSVFYMYPARYFPAKTSTQEIIDNLAYCMNCMCETSEKDSSEGIAFLAYMKDWKMANFSVNYCYQFMMMLQGRIPVRVRMFLIVNPPSWFSKIWAIMKPMLAPDFRKKVHVIPEAKVSQFLEPGFESYLPSEMAHGKADVEELCQNFVTYRKRVEAAE